MNRFVRKQLVLTTLLRSLAMKKNREMDVSRGRLGQNGRVSVYVFKNKVSGKRLKM